MKRVVVTGMGMVSSLGHSLQSSWTALLNGESGVRQIINDPVFKNNKSYNIGLVRQFDYKSWKVSHAQSRLTSFLYKSTVQALQNAQIDLQAANKQRIGVCIGALASSNSKLLEHIEESSSKNYENINRLSMLQVLTNIPAATLGVKYKLKGPSLTVSTACASGLSAIVQATKWIMLGQADVVIAGASQDVYNPLYLNSSIKLQAMTTKTYAHSSMASRPFDKARSGFVLGQGSGILILQSYDHAAIRKAKILAEIRGYGYTSDGDHLVRPQLSGQGQKRAMKNALIASSLSPKDIDYINVHATSTPTGDQIQARAVLDIFKNSNPTITANKSNIGHAFAAAGAIESIFTIKSINEPDVPQLKYARKNERQQIRHALKNSFGFGGINVSCIFSAV